MRGRGEFRAYFRRLADLMALKDWEVSIDDEPPDDENVADISRISGAKRARVRLSDGFLAATEEDQRHTAVHELEHLHLTVIDFFVKEKLGAADMAVYRMLREYAVDGIADGVAAGFPLPSEVLDAPTTESRKKRTPTR